MSKESSTSVLKIGDPVRHLDTGEVGVVVWMWDVDDSGADAYVAFYGDSFPVEEPTDKPYVLRYYTTSLEKIDWQDNGEPQR